MEIMADVAQTVDTMLRDWAKVVYLYRIVHEFASFFDDDFKSKAVAESSSDLHSMVTVRSYTYTNLVLGYGPGHEVTVSVSWCDGFQLVFSGSGNSISAHSIMRQQLEAQLNASHNLFQLVRTLHETYFALTSVARLPIIPHLGIPVSYPGRICFLIQYK